MVVTSKDIHVEYLRNTKVQPCYYFYPPSSQEWKRKYNKWIHRNFLNKFENVFRLRSLEARNGLELFRTRNSSIIYTEGLFGYSGISPWNDSRLEWLINLYKVDEQEQFRAPFLTNRRGPQQFIYMKQFTTHESTRMWEAYKSIMYGLVELEQLDLYSHCTCNGLVIDVTCSQNGQGS